MVGSLSDLLASGLLAGAFSSPALVMVSAAEPAGSKPAGAATAALRRLVLCLLWQVAAGMEHVHRCGVLHGDLSASNVLLILNTLLALPSVVVGLVVYLLLSRSGPLGFLGWLFSFKAMVLAQVILVLPVVTALTRQVVEDVERLHGEQWASLGAGAFVRSLPLAWDERLALMTIFVTAFGRAIAEVGAVMIVGGNIDGFTRVMTTAIALETSKGDLPLALALGMVLLAVVGLLNLVIAWLRRRAEAESVTQPAWAGEP